MASAWWLAESVSLTVERLAPLVGTNGIKLSPCADILCSVCWPGPVIVNMRAIAESACIVDRLMLSMANVHLHFTMHRCLYPILHVFSARASAHLVG